MDFRGVLRRGFELALSLTAPPATVDFTPLVIDEITVISLRYGSFPPALAVLARGEIRTFPMIDVRFPLPEAPPGPGSGGREKNPESNCCAPGRDHSNLSV